MDPNIQDLWDRIEELEEIRSQKAISCIVEQLDSWMCDGKFDLVDESLLFDPSTKSIEVSLAFLVMSFPARKMLKNRDKLFEASKEYYSKVRPDEVDGLLQGLK